MLSDALEGWKSCVSNGSAGSVLAAKSKVTKMRLKNWSSHAKLGDFSVKRLEDRLAAVDTRAAAEDWSEVLKADRAAILADIWAGLRREEQIWGQKSKTQSERNENMILKQEHDRIQVQNEMLKEATRNLLCTNCGSLVAMSSGGGDGIDFEIERLRLENAQLKDEFNKICMLTSRFLGRPISSLSPSDGEGTSASPPPPPPMAASMVGIRGIPFNKNVFIELAVAAMDILMKLA
ncbi:hypothetical protein LWI29_026670 [Acer saccharum]|uniref:Uncharacterized protein n=1 Tax=Acer saccharum TaxID=4024 RepID=A0AA39SR76_ACESA|nr:hypothetical protein LWI29_026670 [Acer saccharum]